MERRLRALEFFSGIGGLHVGFTSALENDKQEDNKVKGEVVVSFDINHIANECHQLNFPNTYLYSKTLLQLNVKSLSKLMYEVMIVRNQSSTPLPSTSKFNRKTKKKWRVTEEDLKNISIDVWLLSPPCQPFTRRGNKKDTDDERNFAFLHLIKLLPSLPPPLQPNFILIENVVGFEVSQTREMLVEMIEKAGGYSWQEFHLSPTSFGIPNQRSRYFFLVCFI